MGLPPAMPGEVDGGVARADRVFEIPEVSERPPRHGEMPGEVRAVPVDTDMDRDRVEAAGGNAPGEGLRRKMLGRHEEGGRAAGRLDWGRKTYAAVGD